MAKGYALANRRRAGASAKGVRPRQSKGETAGDYVIVLLLAVVIAGALAWVLWTTPLHSTVKFG